MLYTLISPHLLFSAHLVLSPFYSLPLIFRPLRFAPPPPFFSLPPPPVHRSLLLVAGIFFMYLSIVAQRYGSARIRTCLLYCRMSERLQKLFGSVARVKLLRLFLFNPRASFTFNEVAKRARVSEAEARQELALLQRVGVVERVPRSRTVRLTLNKAFEYRVALQDLLLNAPARGDDILGRLRGAGSFKLVVISGIFVGEWDGRLDLLVVGDKLNERKLRERIKQLEAEIGKEMRYALLSTEDFYYRYNMNDKLVRDVVDYSHRTVLDRLNIGLK